MHASPFAWVRPQMLMRPAPESTRPWVIITPAGVPPPQVGADIPAIKMSPPPDETRYPVPSSAPAHRPDVLLPMP